MTGLISAAMNVLPWRLRRLVGRIPGLSFLQRKLVSITLSGKEFVHASNSGPAAGIKFLVRMPEDKGIWTGTYEADFAARVAASVRPGMVAYDIGGWHGFFTGIMAKGGASVVHVFEPLPENIRRLERMMELNPDLPIHLHRCGLGAEEGEMDLLVLPDSSMAKLASSEFQPDARSSERHRVPIRTIDALISSGSIAPPDLIKMDIEGAEFLALQGARAVLERHRPVIFAEMHSPTLHEQCSNLLHELGFETELLERLGDGEDAVFQVMARPRR